jgi:hypothetical protein
MMAEISAAGYSIDAMAGHSRCALLGGDQALAKQLADEVWTYLRQSGPGGLEFPMLAYESCALVFESAGDSAAHQAIVETSYDELMKRAQRISDDTWRDSYLHKVPEHRALVARWEKLSGKVPE